MSSHSQSDQIDPKLAIFNLSSLCNLENYSSILGFERRQGNEETSSKVLDSWTRPVYHFQHPQILWGQGDLPEDGGLRLWKYDRRWNRISGKLLFFFKKIENIRNKAHFLSTLELP